MNNEEKASKLCDLICSACKDEICREDVEDVLLCMAEWKDKQIDTILLTMEGCLRSFFESRGNSEESINTFINAIKAQIDKNLEEL